MEREEEKGCVSHPPIIPSGRRHEGFFQWGSVIFKIRQLQTPVLEDAFASLLQLQKKREKTLCDTVHYLFVSGHKHTEISLEIY